MSRPADDRTAPAGTAQAGQWFRQTPSPWLGFGVAGGLVIADRISKIWIDGLLALGDSMPVLPVLSLTRVHNYGISLGLFQAGSDSGRWLLVGLTAAIAIALTIWLLRRPPRLTSIAVATVLGGAIGNIWDRAQWGFVLDFLHVHAGGWSFYVFNVADAAITVGVGLLLLDSLLHAPKKPN